MTVKKNILEEALDPSCVPTKIVGEIFYFTEPPGDILPNLREDPQNQKEWTALRRDCYLYIKRHFFANDPKKLILDLGVGPAQFQEVYSKAMVIGADYYPYPDANVICDFTKRLPFRDGVFDVVIASNVFEHLFDPQTVMDDLYRVLKPGGKIIGATPFLIPVHQAPYDFYRYTHFAIRQILEKSQFIVEDVSAAGSAVDAYEQIQGKMFHLARDLKNMHPGFFVKIIIYAVVTFLWSIQRCLNVVFRPVLSRVGSIEKYTAGYGFVGVKSASR